MRAFIVLLLAACSAPVTGLEPPSAVAPKSSPDEPKKPAPEPKPGGKCPEIDPRLNEIELQRIGFSLSPSIVQARLRAADPTRVVAVIEKVWLGPSFLEGFELRVPLDEQEISSLRLPGEYLIGFRGNAYPTPDPDDGISWWSALVIAPVESKELLGRSIGYQASPSAVVVAVQIARQDEDRTYFRVIETISGNPPTDFAENWTRRAFSAPFPAPSDSLWLATLGTVGTTPEGLVLATIADFRPDTAENREIIQAELTDPAQPWRDLEGFVDEVRTSWTFANAPSVVGAVVTGLAGECCTNAGGTYVAHGITERIRGASDAAALLSGGHGYYGSEACGESSFLALERMVPFEGSAEGTFGCKAPIGGPSLESALSVVSSNLDASPDSRARLDRWLAEPAPLFRLHPDSAELTRADAGGPDGMWSRTTSVEEALAAATSFARLTVREVVEHDEWSEVVLETNFYQESYDHLPKHRIKLAFECGDPRLMKVGMSWLGAFVFDATTQSDPSRDPARGFLVPGVLLPAVGTSKAIAAAFYSK
ncbi:MAG: hypothetical protein HYV07_07265 [Deltaproteobacteria bacterium]|nr:hypothetical protein [Deltaproteobacteria bacterium]